MEEIKSEQLRKFKEQFPNINSGDLQAFVLGMNAIEEALKSKIAELEKRNYWLYYLEAIGVDNWEGNDIAIDLFNERYPQEYLDTLENNK